MSAYNHLFSGTCLWSIALDTLDPHLKESLIVILKDQKGDIVSTILEEAEKKKNICLQKRWKVQFRGKTIVLRDLFDKIIAWVNQFSAVVDVAVQFNPSGASLPWAGVRFLLHVAVSDCHCFESTVYGLESVSLLVARYAAFEALYLQRGSTIQAELQRGLTNLYARILTFLAHGIQYFSQPAAKRLVKSVFQTSQTGEIDGMAKLDEEIIKLARISDSQNQQQTSIQVNKTREIVETLQSPICRLVDASMTYAKALKEERFRDVVNWLSSVPYTQHQERHSADRLLSSAQWLLRHPQYIEWKGSSSSALFLLHGIPGSGKTCLTSAVVDMFLRERTLNPLSAPIAYFYCGDSRLGRSWADPEEVMRSLTRQLAIVDRERLKIHELIALEYARREAEAKLDGFEMPRLRPTECADLILNILGGNPAVIIIDGVDEVEEHQRHELLDTLIRVRDESASVMKIFLSSRDNNNVIAGLPGASMLRVKDTDTRQDMEVFVEHCVSTAISTRNLLDGNVSGDLRHEINQFLLNRAGEMFLWVKLQVELLCKLKSASSVSEVVGDVPKSSPTIDQLYSDILTKLAQADYFAYKTAARAFAWLLCMREPLSTTAIVDAVSSGTSDNHKLSLSELLSICSNLVIVDIQLDTLRFAHVSFKEFLETKPEFDTASAHKVAALGCLEACISTLPIEIGSKLLPHQDYCQYAVLYWAQHYTASFAVDGDIVIKKLEEFVLSDDGLAFQLWLEAANEASELLPNRSCLKKELNAVLSEPQTPFFTACIYGLKGIFDTSVQNPDFDANSTNLLGHTGLYLAAAFGNHKLVASLISLGADIGVSRGKWEDPLSAACIGGHSLVASLLLNQEAYSDAMKIEPALRLCFLTGQEGLSKLLLKSYLQIPCDKPDVKRKNDEWLLEAAAQAGFSGIMEELGKVSSPNHLPKKNSLKIVTAAIRKGQISFIEKLLEKGSLPANVVATAALFGKTEIINLCLHEGYNIEKEGPFGTPLRSASLMGHENAVRDLLSRGADVNSVTPLGDALQAAAMKGHLSITNILIQFNANVDNSGGFFGNALQAAAYRGHRDVAAALLSAGASIHSRGRYKDAFHAAAEGGQDGIIDYFLEKGYTFSPIGSPVVSRILALRSLPSRFKDLLRCASPSFHDHGSGYPQRTGRFVADQEPPEAFVTSFDDVFNHTGDSLVSYNDIPESLYEHRASRDDLDLEKDYCLEVAASRGHWKVVERLLASRERLGIGISHLEEALRAACTNGHSTVVKLITSMEDDLRHCIRETLKIAASRGYSEIMEILIEYEEIWSALANIGPERASEGSTSQNKINWPNWGSPHTLPLVIVLAGCQGGQVASVKRGLRWATQSETKRIRELCLAEAARFNQSDIVELLLQDDAPLSPETLARAMQAAAESGSKTTLALLVSATSNEEIFADCYTACVTNATLNGHAEVVEYLLAQSASRWSLETLQKAFIHACREEYLPIMTLLAEKIQKNEAYPLLLTQALNFACAAGKRESADWLINAGSDIDAMVDEIPEPFAKELLSHRKFFRVHDKSHESWPRTALQACLQSIKGPEKHYRFPWDIKIQSLEPVIKLLLEHGADVNQTLDGEMTALHLAAQNLSQETVQTMIARSAYVNINIPGKGTPLQLAARRELNALPVVCLLLESGAISGSCEDAQQQWKSVLDTTLTFFGSDPSNEDNMCGLFSESGSIQDVLSTGPGAVIKHILLARPEIRALDKRFGLLLQMLAASGDINFIELLLSRGTDVNLCGHYYGCALQAAARFGHLKCVQFLLDANAEVNLAVGTHGTPLQAAIIGKHQEVVTELLAHGAIPAG